MIYFSNRRETIFISFISLDMEKRKTEGTYGGKSEGRKKQEE